MYYMYYMYYMYIYLVVPLLLYRVNIYVNFAGIGFLASVTARKNKEVQNLKPKMVKNSKNHTCNCNIYFFVIFFIIHLEVSLGVPASLEGVLLRVPVPGRVGLHGGRVPAVHRVGTHAHPDVPEAVQSGARGPGALHLPHPLVQLTHLALQLLFRAQLVRGQGRPLGGPVGRRGGGRLLLLLLIRLLLGLVVICRESVKRCARGMLRKSVSLFPTPKKCGR